ncbi:MAG: hypothetical protein ACE37H_06870 [Phycisphaeraceae bacterium]
MASLFILVLLVFVVLGIALTIAFLVVRAANARRGTPGEMGCAACGYPVRGIGGFNCPECGADLRVVGTRKGGATNAALLGCLLPLAYTLVLPIVAGLLFAMLAQFALPTYADRSVGFSVSPASRQYGEILFQTEFTEIYPAGVPASSGVNASTTGGNAPTATITIASPNTTLKIHRVWIEAMTAYPNTVNTYAPRFEVDPQTREARWTDNQGNPQRSKGPLTDQDVLAYFKSAGVDTARPDVKAEAQAVAGTLDGLLNGSPQFTLKGFDNAGYHAGASHSPGPPWLIPAYAVAWLLIWVLGLVVIVRMARKRAPAMNQTKT